MSINLQNKYPGRFDPVSVDYPQGKFRNRSSPTAEDGSYMEREWLNDWNGFFGALLAKAGLTPNGIADTAQSSQFYDALRVVSGAKYGSALIGQLVLWPLQQMPQEIFTDIGQVYIPYIGQSFSKTTYPLLGLIHPSGVLPADMRGEFPRGWDDGRGVDVGRVLMSAQNDALQNFTGTMLSRPIGVVGAGGAITGSNGVFEYTKGGGESGASNLSIGTDTGNHDLVRLNMSLQARTSTETRPRNISWNMIVRAA